MQRHLCHYDVKFKSRLDPQTILTNFLCMICVFCGESYISYKEEVVYYIKYFNWL
jgi:hypothetical protein